MSLKSVLVLARSSCWAIYWKSHGPSLHSVQCSDMSIACSCVQCFQCAVCSVQCAVFSVPCAVCSVQCAVCTVQYVVCSVQCSVCSVQCVGGCHWGWSDGQISVPGCRAAQCCIIKDQSESCSFWTVADSCIRRSAPILQKVYLVSIAHPLCEDPLYWELNACSPCINRTNPESIRFPVGTCSVS